MTEVKPFIWPVRIYYEDTDAAGIVYHTNFIKFAERARTEWLRSLGYDHKTVLKDYGVVFIIKHITIDYKAPARLDDILHVHTTLESLGKTSLTMRQVLWRDDKVLAEVKVTIVAVNPEGRPHLLPPQLRQIFEGQTP